VHGIADKTGWLDARARRRAIDSVPGGPGAGGAEPHVRALLVVLDQWAQPPRLTTPRIGPPARHHQQPITITPRRSPVLLVLANNYLVVPEYTILFLAILGMFGFN
jgi:hypothetical protein